MKLLGQKVHITTLLYVLSNSLEKDGTKLYPNQFCLFHTLSILKYSQ